MSDTFFDDIRRMLAIMKSEYDLAGDRDIIFSLYHPASDRIVSQDDRIEHEYASVVNRFAGKHVKLSTIIAELDHVIQQPYD